MSDVTKQTAVGALLFSALLNLVTAAVTPITSGSTAVANYDRAQGTRSSDAAVIGSRVAIQYLETVDMRKYSTHVNDNHYLTLAKSNTSSGRSSFIDDESQIGREGSSISSLASRFDLDAKMQAVQQEIVMEKKLLLLVTLHGDLAEFRATAFQKFRTVAEKQLGLPTLREQLRKAELGDKADPLYPLFKSDSTRTAKVRAALILAEGEVQSTVENIAALDPDFNRVIVSVNSFLASQKDLIAISRTRVEETERNASIVEEPWVPPAVDFSTTSPVMDIRSYYAGREALDRAREATEDAEKAAADLRDELNRSEVRSRNALQMTVLVFLIVGLIAYIIIKARRGR